MARYQGDLMQTNKPSVYEINHASILRRFATLLIDSILLVVLITGLFALMSIIFDYDAKYAQVEEKYVEHGVYIPSSSTESGYTPCSYYDENGVADETSACWLAWEDFYQDEEAVAMRAKCDNLIIVMLSSSALIALLISEFAVPLLFKNGQTLGMKIMHTGVIGNDRIKIRGWQLFARVIIGRYVVETMIPIYSVVYMMINPSGGMLGLLVIVGLLIAEVVFLGFTKNHQVVHDLVSATVVIDMDSQFIAKNREELEAHINETVEQQEVTPPFCLKKF